MKALFVVCILVSAALLLFAMRAKRKNPGFLLISLLITFSNLLCFGLFFCGNEEKAHKLLLMFYVCHVWIYFASLWMTISAAERKRIIFWLVPAVILSCCASVAVIRDMSAKGRMQVIEVEKMGSTWWVAERRGSGMHDFGVYHLAIYTMLILSLILMIVCALRAAKLFQLRFYLLAALHVYMLSVELVAVKNHWPVWVIMLILTITNTVVYYFINKYYGTHLRDWALSTFANEMSDGIVLYDDRGEMFFMNDSLKHSLPWEIQSMLRTRAVIDEWLQEKETVYDIEVVRCKNHEDEDVYFTTMFKELGGGDRVMGSLYILHDKTETISKLKAMDEANKELERAGKMKADFLANMSHEIRTPMNAVIGMAEISMREKLPKSVMGNLAQIKSSGRNLINIINDILDYSKIEAGKMEIVPEDYEPLSELYDVSNVLVTRIGDKPLDLFVEVDPKLPKLLHGDAMRIRQILINLANNAIKFTAEGIVSISVTAEKLTDNSLDMVFHVRDTGQGIKTEDLTKLFQNFQQIDSKRNRNVEGTGLGLAISQRLCEAMGGRIGVTSKYGEGSDFYFTVPQQVVDATPGLQVDDAEEKRAIVINDNELMVKKFIEEVERLGVEGASIRKLSEYEPNGKRDFIFFEESRYLPEVYSFLDVHPDVIGVMLVDFDSTVVPEHKNMRVMRRPETSIAMVSVLNNREVVERGEQQAAFAIDYMAPDAKIMIVDDNAINISIAEGLLRPIKAQCVGMLSGKEAIERLKVEQFDLVLMDHMMPEMDGIETTRVIRSEIPSAKGMPIIAATANVMESARDMFVKEGMDDFVAKPMEIRDLLTKVKKWLPEEKIQPFVPDEGEEEELVSNVPESTELFHCLDNKKAMDSLGSAELFQSIVAEYYRAGAGKADEIEAAYRAEDWKDYTIKVHALKSASRQIGAGELGELAASLEIAGKEERVDEIREKTDTLLADYRGLLSELSVYFPAQEEAADVGDLPEIPPEELSRIMREVLVACDNLDTDTLEELREELKRYSHPAERGELLEQMYTAVDDMDIDICQNMAQQIVNQN